MEEDVLTSPTDLLKQFGQYATLILIPLLFGGITSLVTLPTIAAGKAFLPPLSFWPILITILIFVIGQGVSIYFAGANHGLWFMATLGGFCLFSLLTVFTISGPIPALLLLIGIIALGIYIVRRCFHPIPEGIVDIVYTFQKYNRTLHPGFNILLPWEKIHAQLNTQEIQWLCPEQVIQLSRDEDVVLRGVISYQMVPEDAHLAITQVNNWEESLRDLFVSSIHTVATALQPNDFIPWNPNPHSRQIGDDYFVSGFERREEVNNQLLQLMQDKVALWGIQINWVSLRNIEVVAHGSVRNEVAATHTPPPTEKETDKVHTTASEIEQQTAPNVVNENPRVTTKATLPIGATTARAEIPITPAMPVRILPEDVLINAYKQVQEGKITDPETIRSIAANFEAVANDPKASQEVNFDPSRAALNLYDQAFKFEQELASYGDKTETELVMRRPSGQI